MSRESALWALKKRVFPAEMRSLVSTGRQRRCADAEKYAARNAGKNSRKVVESGDPPGDGRAPRGLVRRISRRGWGGRHGVRFARSGLRAHARRIAWPSPRADLRASRFGRRRRPSTRHIPWASALRSGGDVRPRRPRDRDLPTATPPIDAHHDDHLSAVGPRHGPRACDGGLRRQFDACRPLSIIRNDGVRGSSPRVGFGWERCVCRVFVGAHPLDEGIPGPGGNESGNTWVWSPRLRPGRDSLEPCLPAERARVTRPPPASARRPASVPDLRHAGACV